MGQRESTYEIERGTMENGDLISRAYKIDLQKQYLDRKLNQQPALNICE